MDEHNMVTTVKSAIKESILTKEALLIDYELLDKIILVSQKCIKAINRRNKILFAGNGGSAADCQHIAAELINQYNFNRDPLPAIALTTDTSNLTSIGNDRNFDEIFSRQIQALGNTGDIFIAISTSGNSANIIKAITEAKKLGLYSVGLTGKSGGKMSSICDENINIPSEQTPRIQESHILIGHILCDLIENNIFKSIT